MKSSMMHGNKQFWLQSFFSSFYAIGEDQLNIYSSPKLSKDLTMIASKSSYGTIAILISQNDANISRCIKLNLNSNEVLEHPSSGMYYYLYIRGQSPKFENGF